MILMPKKIPWIVFALFAFLACSRDGVFTVTASLPLDELIPADEVRFGKILSESELVPGPGATGWPGDFKLYNSRAGFIIQGNLHPPDRRLLPGVLVDAGWAEPGELPSGDLLFGFSPWPEDTPARVETVVFREERGRGLVIAAGRLEPPGLDYQIIYTLYPGDDPRGQGLLINTTISNPGSSPQTVNPGDWISFGSKLDWQVLDFPGGHKLLAGIGRGISYLYVPLGSVINSLEVKKGEANIHFPEQTLAPGESLSFARWLLASRHGLLETGPSLPGILGFSPGTLRILVPNVQAQENLTVKILQPPDSLVSILSPDRAGNLVAEIPEGTYQIKIESPGLEDYLFPEPVTVSPGTETEIQVSLPGPSRVKFQVWEENNGGWVIGPSPAKLCFKNLREPEKVVRTAALTGSGDLPLPPGIYEVSISRGSEFTLDRFRFELRTGEEFKFQGILRKVVDNESYYSFDPREYTSRSPRGVQGAEDWFTSNISEGLSLLTPTDINAVTRFSLPAFLPGDFSTVSFVSGVELLPRTGPPLILLPAVFDGLSGWGGIPLAESLEAIARISFDYSPAHLLGAVSESLADLVPSADSVTRPVRLDLPLDFVEISDAEADLNRWFSLLNSGYRVTAFGGSGAGSLADGIGFPRTLVPRGQGHSHPEADLVNAVKTQRALVSAGPRLRMRANYYDFDSHPLISDTSGDIDLEIELESPVWTPVTELIIFGNGKRLQTIPVDFSTTQALGGHRFSRRFYVNLTTERDTWYVALVRGQGSLAPVCPGHPYAFTNPIWVDTDGIDRDMDGNLFDALNSPLP